MTYILIECEFSRIYLGTRYKYLSRFPVEWNGMLSCDGGGARRKRSRARKQYTEADLINRNDYILEVFWEFYKVRVRRD